MASVGAGCILGPNPLHEDNADRDDDGLSDAQERELGTDPEDEDSDDDGYWDAWEVSEGSDPLDYDDRIYQGFWPYNPDKDALPTNGSSPGDTALGAPFPRRVFVDQFGDTVDLYDFANYRVDETHAASKLIVDVAAVGSSDSHVLAEWIRGADGPDTATLQQRYPSLRDAVQSQRVLWITLVIEGDAGAPPTGADAEAWVDAHPQTLIPILADVDESLVSSGLPLADVPVHVALDPDMTILYFPSPEDPSPDDPLPALGLLETLL